MLLWVSLGMIRLAWMIFWPLERRWQIVELLSLASWGGLAASNQRSISWRSSLSVQSSSFAVLEAGCHITIKALSSAATVESCAPSILFIGNDILVEFLRSAHCEWAALWPRRAQSFGGWWRGASRLEMLSLLLLSRLASGWHIATIHTVVALWNLNWMLVGHESRLWKR